MRTTSRYGNDKQRPIDGGFTLIELLVVISITAILVAIAVPSFQATIAGARSSDAANSLVAAFDLARSEAARRGGNVTVCRSLNPDADSPDCSGAGDWSTGWFVFSDNAAPFGVRDAADLVLLRQQVLAAGAQPRAVIDSLAGAITYQATGTRLNPGGIAAFQVGFRAPADPAPGAAPRCVRVAFVGTTTSTRGVCP